MIGVKIVGTPEVIKNLTQAKTEFGRGLASVMRKIVIDLQRYVKQQKLSGSPLHVRSDRLRGSINWSVEENLSGGAITGKVGTGIVYGAIHEYGFDGIESVREHVRRLRGRTKTQLRAVRVNGQKMSLKVFYRKRGALTGETATISAHKRHMKMPERSYLRSSLSEQRMIILDDLQKGINEVIKRVSK